ncbi:hypothetical protein K2Z83_00300 [Oscillochloris sp. ZM17-4]|uniref:hypothetical protein n=1 Tax=Oscillochloris sp. ZM17-4 TaxID=2866714 RepID=UPI001C7395AB|nr:hypothetical protein [Oscillochloris sp. ZM17-4]MBX0326134.1 hypothetical protein [Oscillochloris sp. ZM17-4]
MNVKIDIRYSLEDVLRELGQDSLTPDGEEIMLSTMHDKFFKGGGCEATTPATEGAAGGDLAARNIAVCMHGPR